jgi:hypothetical protein
VTAFVAVLMSYLALLTVADLLPVLAGLPLPDPGSSSQSRDVLAVTGRAAPPP